MEIIFPLVMQDFSLSRHLDKSIVGIALHEIRGFLPNNKVWLFQQGNSKNNAYKNESGMSITCFCIWGMSSPFSQITLAKLILRISASCSWLNRMNSLDVSYQNRSHFRRFLKCIPNKQPNVGPTSAPCNGVSDMPPVNKSISSTCLLVPNKLTMKHYRSTQIKLTHKLVST